MFRGGKTSGKTFMVIKDITEQQIISKVAQCKSS